jgi:hypothetical protein
VSEKPLSIGFAVLGVDGDPLVPLPGSDQNPTPKSSQKYLKFSDQAISLSLSVG